MKICLNATRSLAGSLTHATPDTRTEGLGQLALVLQQLGLDLVERHAADTQVMEGRVILGVEFLVEGRLEDGIRGVHVLEDVIARGSEEYTDRGYTARRRDLQEALDETHLVRSVEHLRGRRGPREVQMVEGEGYGGSKL